MKLQGRRAPTAVAALYARVARGIAQHFCNTGPSGESGATRGRVWCWTVVPVEFLKAPAYFCQPQGTSSALAHFPSILPPPGPGKTQNWVLPAPGGMIEFNSRM